MGLNTNHVKLGGVKGKHIYLKAEGQNGVLEHYQLQVQPKRIKSEPNRVSVFMTFRRWRNSAGDAENTAPNRIVRGVGRQSAFAFRGFMLDASFLGRWVM